MLEFQIFAANVVIPTAVLTVILVGMRFLWGSSASVDTNSIAGQSTLRRSPQFASVVVLTSVFAIWLAFVLRVPDGLAWWPEDAWTRVPLAVSIVGLAAICSSWIPTKFTLIIWLTRAIALWVATKTVIPTGEAWDFLQPTVATWTFVMVLGPLLGWWLIERLPTGAAAALGLSWILCIAAAAFLSKDFLRITEPMLAIASVLGCVSIGAWFMKRAELIGAVAGPCLFGSGAAVASFQFNSFLGLPDALSWFAIVAPALAGLVTLAVRGKGANQPDVTVVPTESSLSARGILSIVAACLVVSTTVVVWTLIASGGTGGEEPW